MYIKKGLTTRRMVIIGLLGAISIVLGLVPGLGFIPVGPTRATIMHIPVIIGAILEGPFVGGMIGLIFGFFSLFQAATNPTPVSFVFLNPLVSIVPRILIGIITHYVYTLVKNLGKRKVLWILNIIWVLILAYLLYGIYTGIREGQSIGILIVNTLLSIFTLAIGIYSHKKLKNQAVDIMLATSIGTLTNTVGVLFTIYVLYAEEFVMKLGQSPDMARKVITGIGITNGIPEIVIGIIIVTNVVAALSRNK